MIRPVASQLRKSGATPRDMQKSIFAQSALPSSARRAMLQPRRVYCMLALSCSLLASSADAAEQNEKNPTRGKAGQSAAVINFSLLDYRGKHYELRRTDAKVVVLYFTGFSCPMARQSVGKLKALQDRFK